MKLLLVTFDKFDNFRMHDKVILGFTFSSSVNLK